MENKKENWEVRRWDGVKQKSDLLCWGDLNKCQNFIQAIAREKGCTAETIMRVGGYELVNIEQEKLQKRKDLAPELFDLLGLIRTNFKRRRIEGKLVFVIEDDDKLLEDIDKLLIRYAE